MSIVVSWKPQMNAGLLVKNTAENFLWTDNILAVAIKFFF